MSISERLDQIAARCNAATDGPWAIWHSGTDYPQSVVANDDGLSLVAETFTSPKYPAADAEFIAHARTDVPWLIEQVRKRDVALRGVLELHVSQFDRTVDHDGEPGTYCDMCNVGPWPCPTVRAITAALGEET